MGRISATHGAVKAQQRKDGPRVHDASNPQLLHLGLLMTALCLANRPIEGYATTRMLFDTLSVALIPITSTRVGFELRLPPATSQLARVVAIPGHRIGNEIVGRSLVAYRLIPLQKGKRFLERSCLR